MSGQYEIVRDSYNRLRAEISPSFTIGVKLLAEDHPRRVENGVHAYVVADLQTELGPWRVRDIRVMYSQENERFFCRYRQWKTGKNRDGHEEWLDVAGPLDRETRTKIQDAILAVFAQIKEEAKAGTLGRSPRPETVSTIGDQPEVAANLQRLKRTMEENSPAEDSVPEIADQVPAEGTPDVERGLDGPIHDLS